MLVFLEEMKTTQNILQIVGENGKLMKVHLKSLKPMSVGVVFKAENIPNFSCQLNKAACLIGS